MSTVEQESTQLRKELGLTDLVLTQIMFVVGLSWVGAAGTLGTAQIPVWLAAMVAFYVPQAIVVIYLARRFPLEGGLYQWAKLGLNEATAFLVGWNLWLFGIVLLGLLGLQVSNALVYAIGPDVLWLKGHRVFIGAVTGAILGGMLVTSILGLRIGKWFHNAGGGLLLVAFGILILLPLINLATGTLPRSYDPLAITMPAMTVYTFNIFSKLSLGALSGFEYVAVLAGETKNAQRNIARSVLIAAPIIALMFMLGTSSVLAFNAPDKLDLVGPIPQAFRDGLSPFGKAAEIVILIVVLLPATRLVGQASLLFSATSRMPMVAGWDRLIPAWFSKLHPRYRTPVNSLLLIGACAFVLGIANTIGVGEQEAFQVMNNAAGVFYALTYLVLFAVPLVGLGRTGRRAPLWIRISAAVGFATAVMYVGLSVIPIVDVKSPLVFAVKVGGTVVVANLIGAGLYITRRNRLAQRLPEAKLRS
jgi:glutamate:GABA antiporter